MTKENAMRNLIALVPVLILVAGVGSTASADTAATQDKKAQDTATHLITQKPHSKPSPKTTGHPLSSSPVDPNAGTNEDGTPSTTVTNGSQLPHWL
jgi:hypothetical protein